MISQADIQERAREWSLRDDVVEKDYVLGWVLWGIGTEDELRDAWVFKGGTCLKKCYIETYRFSEDLDFTILPDGPVAGTHLASLLTRMLARVSEASGIDFSQRDIRLTTHESGRYTEGRIYYVGPRRSPQVASIRLDLSASERLARPTVSRTIAHPYPDSLPEPGSVTCYSYEEVFAEKIRALGERGRPRDLFDVVNLFRRQEPGTDAVEIAAVLAAKCESKGVAIPTLELVLREPLRAELESEWGNMLAHQLPALPPIADFLAELPNVFDWLQGEAPAPSLPPAPAIAVAGESIDTAWRAPRDIRAWHTGVPLEAIRFAAVNHLLVDLLYGGSWRTIEPYSLRQTKAGNLVLYAVRSDSGADRSYRVDRIPQVKLTNRSFTPRYAIEFSASGPLSAPPTARRSAPLFHAPRERSGTRSFTIQCPYCNKTFSRARRTIHTIVSRPTHLIPRKNRNPRRLNLLFLH